MTTTIEIKDNKLSRDVKDGVYEIKPYRPRRSSPQNRYCHGYLFPEFARILTGKMGQKVSMDFAKEFLKAKCAVIRIDKLNDWTVMPTSKMTTAQMSDFIDKCLKYIAAEWGEYLEEPDEWLKK